MILSMLSRQNILLIRIFRNLQALLTITPLYCIKHTSEKKVFLGQVTDNF